MKASPGDKLPALTLPPISRRTLALYCGGSGDHNPIHVDLDFARNEAGLDDVIAHGMLVKAYLGRLLTDWAGAGSVLEMNVRFRAPIHIGDVVQCQGTVGECEDGVCTVRIAASRQDGVTLVDGSARVRIDQ